MGKKDSQASDTIKRAVDEILGRQLSERDPPETQETLDRLVADGMTELDAKAAIRNVIKEELFDISQQGITTFSRERFVGRLRELGNPR